MKNVYLIEGLDRLGKSTLIDGIQQKNGVYQVVHYEKPKLLEKYQLLAQEALIRKSIRDAIDAPGNAEAEDVLDEDVKRRALEAYQYNSFRTMFGMVRSAWSHGMKFIMDRAHLGEMVYAPLYRKYDGDYVLDLEYEYNMAQCTHAKLILLTEDFEKSKHFNDDGQSLGPSSARAKEQEMFLIAFERSLFLHKQIICVTAEDGNFRPKEDILAEALK